MSQPTRPIARYHGGKWLLAPWIISYFPEHRIYVEPYGGAASVLLRKDRVYAEVYNDLDGEMVNLFRVMRDPAKAEQLIAMVELTPCSRMEFIEAYQPALDSVEQARRTLVKSFMGHGSSAIWRRVGFRKYCGTGRSVSPSGDWRNYPKSMTAIAKRLQGVYIESLEALEVMTKYDSPETLHYVDPPYVQESRSGWTNYRHDMTDEDQIELLNHLHTLQGFVILSGYQNELYNDRLQDWIRVDRLAHADGAAQRVESLWLNPACSTALDGMPNVEQRTFDFWGGT